MTPETAPTLDRPASRRRVADAWRYVRRRGLMAAARGLVHRYVYGHEDIFIIHTELAGPPADNHAGDIVFRRATPADWDRLLALEPYGRGSVLRARVIEDDDWLFVACHGDRIIALRHYSRLLPPHGLAARVVALQPSQVWMVDIFCLPEYRSLGIGRRLAVFSDRALAAKGYSELLASVAVTNTPSLRLSANKGSRAVCRITYVRFLFYARLRVSRDLPADLATILEGLETSPRRRP